MSTKIIKENSKTSMFFEDLPIGEWFSFYDEQDSGLFRLCCKISENSAIVFDNNFPEKPSISEVNADESIYLEDVEIRVL